MYYYTPPPEKSQAFTPFAPKIVDFCPFSLAALARTVLPRKAKKELGNFSPSSFFIYFFSIFCALYYAAAEAVFPVVQYCVLSLRDRPLLFLKLDMQTAVRFFSDKYRLVGLAISKFRHARKGFFLPFKGYPVKAAHLARLTIQGRFITVRNIHH